MIINFASKVVVVAGGTGGLGNAVSRAFLEEDAKVVVTYRKEEEFAALKQAAGAKAAALEGFVVDVTDEAATSEFIGGVLSRHGTLGALVNTVGGYVGGVKLWELETNVFDAMLSLNLRSGYALARAVVPAMLRQKHGSIVNIVSIAGRHGGGPGAGAYATAKGALITLTKGLAKELAAHNVRVNAVSPGVIDTPFHEVFSTPEMIQNIVGTIPMGRVGTSEEVANVIAFLASAAASYLTGETIEVNGGQLML